MKHLFKNLLTAMLLAICSTAVAQQITVRGQLIDADNGDPLIGASVTVEGTTQGGITDIDGKFTQQVAQGSTLVFKYVGYKDLKQKIAQQSGTVDLGTIAMHPDVEVLNDVVVTATMAVARKTPIAVSTVDPVFIEEKLGGQEIPEVLKSTPGVYVTQQGGGYGDSEIFMRGFSQDNIAVNVNGVPVNDMEWGGIYWSNWDGLRDVSRTYQTQRGLGASKVSAPSVGGTINVLTRGIDAKKGGYLSYGMGNDGQNKILLSLSTGLSNSGWAMNMLLARNWGSEYVQGSEYEAYNYYLNISKQINDRNQLSFMVFGAPQEHNQRGNQNGLTMENWEMTKDVYGVDNYRYNPTFGYRKNGKSSTGASRNVYHKPQISINHQWQIDYKSYLNTVLYASIGRGYGYTGQATYSQFTQYTRSDWYGANKGVPTTAFRNSDGTFDYAAIEDLNAASEYGSQLVIAKNKNYHNWYGLVSTYTTKIGKDIDFYGGIDFRYYKGIHTAELTDLYGGQYFMDSSRANVLAENNSAASNPNWKYNKLGVGDVVYRDYDGHVMQEGAFFQAEYNRDKLSGFVSGSLSNTSYWRYDRFYYDAAHARSKTVGYIGFTAKGGANYNITDNHNVFVNLGYISRAPKFSYGAFFTAETSNQTNPDAKNEKILSFEVGYGWRNKWITLNLNGYYTRWMDKAMANRVETSKQGVYGVINMTGVNALHKGVELEAKSSPLKWLTLTGSLSLGDWHWDNNATGYLYDEDGNAITAGGEITTPGASDHQWATLKMKGIKVGGAAQFTMALGADFDITKDVRVGANWNYYGNNYAYYNFNSSTMQMGKEVEIATPWKIPAASQFDINASYHFDIAGLKATLFGNVFNVLGNFYMRKAWNPSSTASTPATADNIYGFYSFGRTYSVRLKVNF
ncbi:MAG: TonB-dependent receptor [Mediterranea sp.]|nr:TonB-dependent receptor [Mediterranea sp.]